MTERATDSISAYSVEENGFAEGPTVFPSAGPTPYGFDFTRAGVLVVTEAAGGKTGAASASSYSLSGPGKLSLVSGSVGDTRSEVCWAAVSPDDRYVYVTNFGDGTISTYTISGDGRIELLHPVAATTVEGQKGIRDEAVSRDGRYIYALHADVQKLFGWEVREDGSLRPVGAFGDLPTTVAGHRRKLARPVWVGHTRGPGGPLEQLGAGPLGRRAALSHRVARELRAESVVGRVVRAGARSCRVCGAARALGRRPVPRSADRPWRS